MAIPRQTTNQISDYALEKEQPYKEFVNSLKSPATMRYYTFSLRRYMQFHGAKTCSELLSKDVKLIQADLLKYVEEERSKLSSTTMRAYVASLRNFYEINDVLNINWKKVISRIGEIKKKKDDRAYTTEEIKTLLDYTDERSRVILLLMASTGMRVGAIPTIERHHLKFLKDYGIFAIRVYPGTSQEYTTFCTPECAKAINNYLTYRERYGETIEPESPLIREKFDINDHLMISNPRPLSAKAIIQIMYQLVQKAGLRQIKRMVEGSRYGTARHDVSINHGLRKWFNTTLKNSSIKPLFTEMWLGHTVGLEGAYFRPTQEDHIQEYIKAIDILTIDPANRLAEKVHALSSDLNNAQTALEDALLFHMKYIQIVSENSTFEQNARYMEKMLSADPKFKAIYDKVHKEEYQRINSLT